MPLDKSLYEQNNTILNKVCDIKDHILKRYNKDKTLKLNVTFNNITFEAQIRLNTYKSPDGAMGMFLLIKKNSVKFNPTDNLLNQLIYKGDCNHIKTIINFFERQFIQKYGNRKRLQEKFEFMTFKKLEMLYNGVTAPININDYDFLCDTKTAFEVKSDQFYWTGNVSLELLRNYNIQDCENNEPNIGSILKTKADYWQEYFYDNNNFISFETELYEVKTLQQATNKIITDFYNAIKQGII